MIGLALGSEVLFGEECIESSLSAAGHQVDRA